jgi:hypothetical protein
MLILDAPRAPLTRAKGTAIHGFPEVVAMSRKMVRGPCPAITCRLTPESGQGGAAPRRRSMLCD